MWIDCGVWIKMFTVDTTQQPTDDNFVVLIILNFLKCSKSNIKISAKWVVLIYFPAEITTSPQNKAREHKDLQIKTSRIFG